MVQRAGYIPAWKIGGITRCPSVPRQYRTIYPNYFWNGIRCHYTYNQDFGYLHWSVNTGIPPRKLAYYKRPSAKMLLADTGANYVSDRDYCIYAVADDYNYTGTIWARPPHDNSAFNMAFLDGHAQRIRESEFKALASW